MKLDQDETKNEMNRLQQAISIEDELRAEYDLKCLRIRKVGASRTSFNGRIIRLALDDVEAPQCWDSE